MSNHRSSRALTIAMAAVLAVGTPLLLSGCGLIPNPVEGVIEGVTGGDIELPGSTVPDDFPSEVPLIDGEVVFGTGFGNDTEKIWNVTINVGSEATEQIASGLESAGFTVSAEGSLSGDTGTLFYQKDELSVLVVIAEDNDSGGYVASYTVTRGSGE